MIQIPMLTEQEVSKIFSWLPYRDDWPVDRNQDSIDKHYGDLISSFMSNKSFDTYYSEDGGLGNYLEFMCYPRGQKEYGGNAVLACISLCSPFAAYGQITICKKTNSFGWGHMFSPEQANCITDPTLLEIEDGIQKILKDNKLYLLDKEFLSRELPIQVVDNLKFENHNEGDQYLHGIFQ